MILNIFLVFLTFIFLFATVVFTWITLTLFRTHVPPIPTGKKRVLEMLQLTSPKEGDLFIDLGCGFGDVLFLAEKNFSVRIIGYELSWPIAFVARLRKFFQSSRVQIVRKDFYKVLFNNADIVFTYLWPTHMERIEKEIWPQLKTGSRLVSCAFPFPNIKPSTVQKIGQSNVYLYVKDKA